MGLLNIFKKKENRSQALNDVQQRTYNLFNGVSHKSIDPANAHIISTVYSCVNILSNTISRLPISVYQKSKLDKTELTGHRLYNTLKYNPQSYYNDQQWKSTLIAHLCFNGNSYAYINPNNNELEIIHPNSVNDIKEVYSKRLSKKSLWYAVSQLNSDVPATIKGSDILHFKTFSRNNFYGLSPIDAVRLEMNIQYKAEKTVDSFFTKNGNATKFLETVATNPQDLTGAKINEIIKNFTDNVSIDNTDSIVRVPPLHTIKELGLNTEAINFLSSNKYTVAQIGSVFGVPDYLLGINVNSQYGKYEEQSIAFKQTTIQNLVSMIQSELNFKLLTPMERAQGITIEFDLSPLDSIDTTTKINYLTQLKNAGAISPNEMRVAFGLNAINNENMNGYYMQMQYTNLIQSGSTVTQLNK